MLDMAKVKPTGCLQDSGFKKKIVMDQGGLDLMGYNAANLKQYEARKIEQAWSSERMHCSCFCLFSFIFLVVILGVTKNVGTLKQFTLVDELQTEKNIEFSDLNFPLHNFISFSSLEDLKNQVGGLIYASSSKRLLADKELGGGTGSTENEHLICENNEKNYWDDTTGTCITCPDKQYADKDNHVCISDTCDAATQVLGVSGKCITCVGALDGETCANTCTFRQTVALDGSCTDCAEYTLANDAKDKCIDPTCDAATQIIKTDGTCETCGDYYFVDGNQKNCVQDTCTVKTQILLTTGKCSDCAQYEYADDSQRECVADTCTVKTQVL